MLWLTRVWELTRSHGPRFRLGPPERVEWYVDGRSATRAEVQTSLAEKMQELERHAYEWPGGLAGLRRHRASLNVWLPGK